VHDEVWEAFVEAFLQRARQLRVGDPLDPEMDVGPMVNLAAVQRVQGWIEEARSAGARVLLSGHVEGNFMSPTVLTDVPPSAALWREEVFGPVAVLSRFDDIAAAFAQVNDSRFGLHAGIFTNRLDHAWLAFAELEVGGVIVNDAPTYRVDNMPFGGVKDSGLGREGLRWAIEDMTETRTLVLAGLP
jgi:acyl-CoA reductase-like NAD-dependent aldehyde dehydrogenase